MGDRQELVRRAFAALDSGDIEPFMELESDDLRGGRLLSYFPGPRGQRRCIRVRD